MVRQFAGLQAYIKRRNKDLNDEKNNAQGSLVKIMPRVPRAVFPIPRHPADIHHILCNHLPGLYLLWQDSTSLYQLLSYLMFNPFGLIKKNWKPYGEVKAWAKRKAEGTVRYGGSRCLDVAGRRSIISMPERELTIKISSTWDIIKKVFLKYRRIF